MKPRELTVLEDYRPCANSFWRCWHQINPGALSSLSLVKMPLLTTGTFKGPFHPNPSSSVIHEACWPSLWDCRVWPVWCETARSEDITSVATWALWWAGGSLGFQKGNSSLKVLPSLQRFCQVRALEWLDNHRPCCQGDDAWPFPGKVKPFLSTPQRCFWWITQPCEQGKDPDLKQHPKFGEDPKSGRRACTELFVL